MRCFQGLKTLIGGNVQEQLPDSSADSGQDYAQAKLGEEELELELDQGNPNESLKEQLEAVNELLALEEARVSELSKERDDLVKELETVRGACESPKMQLAVGSALELAEAMEQHQLVQVELDEAKKEITRLTMEVKQRAGGTEWKNKCRLLEQELSDTREQLRQSEVRLNQANELRQEADQNRGHVMGEYARRVNQLDKEKMALQAELAESRQTLVTEQTAREGEQRVQELTAKLAARELAEAQQALREKDRNLAAVTSQLADAELRIRQIENDKQQEAAKGGARYTQDLSRPVSMPVSSGRVSMEFCTPGIDITPRSPSGMTLLDANTGADRAESTDWINLPTPEAVSPAVTIPQTGSNSLTSGDNDEFVLDTATQSPEPSHEGHSSESSHEFMSAIQQSSESSHALISATQLSSEPNHAGWCEATVEPLHTKDHVEPEVPSPPLSPREKMLARKMAKQQLEDEQIRARSLQAFAEQQEARQQVNENRERMNNGTI